MVRPVWPRYRGPRAPSVIVLSCDSDHRAHPQVISRSAWLQDQSLLARPVVDMALDGHRCANSGTCGFLSHTDYSEFGGYCCNRCKGSGGHRHGGYCQRLPITKHPDELTPLKYTIHLPSLGQVVCVFCGHDKHSLVQAAAKLFQSVSTILKTGTVKMRNMWDGHGMSLLESELWAYAGPLARSY